MRILNILLLPALASGQDYWRECQSRVADRVDVSMSDVSTDKGPDVPNGNRVVNWRARTRDGQRITGYCVVNPRNNRVVELERGSYRGPVAGGGGNSGGGGNITPPRVRVDTSGRGNFSGPGQTVRITRGWVDTSGQPTVSLSGEDNFRINFYGDIERQNGDREFTMRITGSDRGNARGTATFRLNRDRNEVEYVNVNGRMGGANFSGSFNR